MQSNANSACMCNVGEVDLSSLYWSQLESKYFFNPETYHHSKSIQGSCNDSLSIKLWIKTGQVLAMFVTIPLLWLTKHNNQPVYADWDRSTQQDPTQRGRATVDGIIRLEVAQNTTQPVSLVRLVLTEAQYNYFIMHKKNKLITQYSTTCSAIISVIDVSK